MTDVARAQRDRLRRVLAAIRDGNDFYRRKLADAGSGAPDPDAFELADLATLPFTTKDELVADQQAHPPFGSDLSFPLDRYVRLHQTSGTQGRPLRWLDTAESWDELLASWRLVFEAIALTPADRVFLAFSFGPFIGFWGAFEAAQRLGALTLTGGALSTRERLEQIVELEATVLVCTPTYALHLAEVAAGRGIDLASTAIRATLHAGEPGASVPAVRERLEAIWGAACWDHAGATELGAWGYPGGGDRMRIDEERFLAELVDPATGAVTTPGPDDGAVRGELVLSSLGRVGSPLLRYRTGDLVEMIRDRRGLALRGGVLGRLDDMTVVRGVNVYPSAIENVVREIPEITEFRATVAPARGADGGEPGGLRELEVEIETAPGASGDVAAELAALFRARLSLRVPVRRVEAGSLPRWELKSRRFRIEG